ncbi:MAG: hypothetical protein JOY90_15065 [Bradyrhizobium sp.]|uniref:hypothetical protein n=1 Tax=Bradyrhizobium sp. TaxID=376 RepID=UPI001D5D2102|nr:hypothetical protein [Bradyrhizobium sp.]MBV9561749.1 hypothetical protein [Bradyrhizobium sp.]
MRTGNGRELVIDDVHTRAICEEIGDRLREMLARSMSSELPPLLCGLMRQLEKADGETAPSLAPSIEDMSARNEADRLPA